MSIYLNVRFEQKDVAKSNGAKWDGARRQWFYPGTELPSGLRAFAPVQSHPEPVVIAPTTHTIERHIGVYGPFGRYYSVAGDLTDSLIERAATYNKNSTADVWADLKTGAEIAFDRDSENNEHTIRSAEAAAYLRALADARRQHHSDRLDATNPRMTCRCCGQSGRRGSYPFSTLPGSGRCDDCV